METLEMRLHTEHKARLARFEAAASRHNTIQYFDPPAPEPSATSMPAITDEQIREAHLAFDQHWANKVEIIQRAVLAKFPDITMADIKSQSRNAKCVLPRHIGMYLCKELTNKSLPDIGRRFGGRDHTTVLNAVNRVTSRLLDDEQFRQLVNRIREGI
jgi:chromosomal replication initiation ATPase DnaA